LKEVNPGNRRQSGSTTSRPRRGDFSDDVCALADAAKIHLRFKLAMGEVNKLGADDANRPLYAYKTHK